MNGGFVFCPPYHCALDFPLRQARGGAGYISFHACASFPKQQGPVGPAPSLHALSVQQEIHCPLPQGSAEVFSRSSPAHCPQAVRQHAAGVPLPTAPEQNTGLKKAFFKQRDEC